MQPVHGILASQVSQYFQQSRWKELEDLYRDVLKEDEPDARRAFRRSPPRLGANVPDRRISCPAVAQPYRRRPLHKFPPFDDEVRCCRSCSPWPVIAPDRKGGSGARPRLKTCISGGNSSPRQVSQRQCKDGVGKTPHRGSCSQAPQPNLQLVSVLWSRIALWCCKLRREARKCTASS